MTTRDSMQRVTAVASAVAVLGTIGLTWCYVLPLFVPLPYGMWITI